MYGKRYFFCFIIAFAMMNLGVIFSGGLITRYFDLPSILVVFGVSIPMLRVTWSFSEMGKIFVAVFSRDAELERLKDAILFFGSATKIFLFAGLFAIFLGFIAILMNLENPSMIGPSAAVALESMLYSMAVSVFVTLALEALAKKRAMQN